MSSDPESQVLGPPPFLHGRYRLIRQIGKGGMGLVYQAEDERLGRQVAIKFLAPNQISNNQRFFREARVVAQLTHPNIMALYDVGQEQGWHYLILEYLNGQNLHEFLKSEKKSLTTRNVLDLIKPVLQALAYAHDSGVIHRDIKPENIMVMRNGRVKVTDFGLALAIDEERLTTDNTFMGTTLYLAPEIIQGQPATPQSDLYAIGVVLYELLTGQTPFKGKNAANTLIEILNKTVSPPSQFKENILPEWDDLILKLLSKRPEKRPQTAREVLASLPDPFIEKTVQPEAADTRLQEDTAVVLEGERQRLARLLQREIIEPLNLLLAQAGMYGQGLGINPQAQTAVSVLTTLARQVMQQARDLEANLRPTILESLGLEPALEAFVSQISRSRGTQVKLHFPHLVERLPYLLELAIFRATQEITEAAIHDGHATEITIQMQEQDERYNYSVQDNRQTSMVVPLLPATQQQIRQLGGEIKTDLADGRHLLILQFGQASPIQLTPRELEVLQCLVAGMSNKEIALALEIKPRTVNFHLDNLYSKLNVNSRTEAAMLALRQGWVTDPG